MNSLKLLICQSGYFTLNKALVKEIGINETLFLSALIDAAEDATEFFDDDWFYQTSTTIEELTTLSRRQQDRCIKKLDNLSILEKRVFGMPAKRYFKINYDILDVFI